MATHDESGPRVQSERTHVTVFYTVLTLSGSVKIVTLDASLRYPTDCDFVPRVVTEGFTFQGPVDCFEPHLSVEGGVCHHLPRLTFVAQQSARPQLVAVDHHGGNHIKP